MTHRSRGGAAAATWTFRGDALRRYFWLRDDTRKDQKILSLLDEENAYVRCAASGRVAAPPRPRRGYFVESRRRRSVETGARLRYSKGATAHLEEFRESLYAEMLSHAHRRSGN